MPDPRTPLGTKRNASMETPNTAPAPAAPVAPASTTRNAGHRKVQLVECCINDLDFIQPRGGTDDDKVEDFSEAYASRKEVPPPSIWIVDGVSTVVDGNHRTLGRRKAGFDTIECIVAGQGSRRQAVQAALQSNHTNGLHRTREMKREYVRLALTEFPDWSDRALAALCGVTDKLVGVVADELRIDRTSRLGADGKTRRLPSTRRPPVSEPLSSAPFRDPIGTELDHARPSDGAKSLPDRVQWLTASAALRAIQVACTQLAEAGEEYDPVRHQLLELEDRLHKSLTSLREGVSTLESLGLDPLHVLIRTPGSGKARSDFVREVRMHLAKLPR